MTYREAVFYLMLLGLIPAVLFVLFHTANTWWERGWRGWFTIAFLDSIAWVILLGGIFAWYVAALATNASTSSRPWDDDTYVLAIWLALLDFALWARYLHWLWYAWKKRKVSSGRHVLLDDDRQEQL